MLRAISQGRAAQVAAEPPGAEAAGQDREGRDHRDLRQGGGLRDGQRLEGDAHGDHRDDRGAVEDRHDRPHRGAQRAGVLLDLAGAGQRGVDASDIGLAQLRGIRMGEAGAIPVHDRDEVDVRRVQQVRGVGLQTCGGIGSLGGLGDERCASDGLRDRQHPVGRGLVRGGHGPAVDDDAEGQAEGDDECQLQDEQATGQ